MQRYNAQAHPLDTMDTLHSCVATAQTNNEETTTADLYKHSDREKRINKDYCR